jgi:NTE family protein
MSERVVLVLNGGAALGAYQCGVYRALVRQLDATALRRMVVVGASIGAVNGFLIAAHSAANDSGTAALERFWHDAAQPSLPFVPIAHPYWARLNGTLTGLLLGNRAVFQPLPGGFWGGVLAYPYWAAYDGGRLSSTLSGLASGYGPGAEGPRLLVRAIDVMAAQPVWFDSSRQRITPSMIAASASVPLLFRAQWYGGRAFWDGDIWPQGILADVLQRLETEEGGGLHVVSVELLAPRTGLPVGLGNALDHFRAMFLGRRSDQDAAAAHARQGVRLTRIRRASMPEDGASAALFDWAPERIEALIEQGEADAARALAAAQQERAQGGRRARASR